MFDKILIPLDGTELSASILLYVTLLAKTLGTRLVVLSVIDPDSLDTASLGEADSRDHRRPMSFVGFIPIERHAHGAPVIRNWHTTTGYVADRSVSQVAEHAESQARTELNAIVTLLGSQGINAEAVVAFGDAADKIVEVARKKDCDLIAMSTHGRNMVSRAILGSVTDKVIRTAHVPTLTITPEKAKQYWENGVKISKILVPLDGSKLAETVLPYVEDLARRLSLEVVLIEAVKIFNVYTPYSGALLYNGDDHISVGVEEDAGDYLNGVAATLRNTGLDVRCRVVRGSPGASIIEAAQAMPDNLIAMTTHGRLGFRRLMLGSVTEAVIRSSGDPVVVVPPMDEI
jgi:nucleotide-binding universal stress UspA family protein